MSVAVATTLDDPNSLIPAVCAEVKNLDPLLAVNVQPIDAFVAAAVARQRLGHDADADLRRGGAGAGGHRSTG